MPTPSVARSQWCVTRSSPALRESLIRDALEIDECQRGEAPDTESCSTAPSKVQRPATGKRSPIVGESTRIRCRPGCESW